MKKILLFMFLLVGTLSANAQFERGKKYVNASLTGIGISYSGSQKFQMGIDASAGYFLGDCFMVRGSLGYDHTDDFDNVNVGLGARYYFDQCGVFLGGGAEYCHFSPSSNDVKIPLEVGYAFFVNRFITIEPSLYYKMSLHDFSDNSTFGVKIGCSFYF